MVVFWIIAIAMLAAALAFILPPLFRKQSATDSKSRTALNVDIFRDQIRELDADLRIGQLSQEQYDQAKADLERSLLESVDDTDNTVSESNAAVNAVIGKASAWVLIMAVPLVSVLLYTLFGGGKEAFNPEQAQPQMSAEGHQGAQIEEMVESLKKRLAENPNDAEGWAMLGRSYYHLGRFEEANQSFAKAVELTADAPNADYLADYADTLAMTSGRSLQGKPMEAILWALKIAPDHPKSLWLAGTAAFENKDYSAARDYWSRLQKLLPPDSQNAQMVQGNLDEVAQLLGESPAAPTEGAAIGEAKVTGHVSLAEAIRAKASPDDVVFVFARAATGPRMPLAIVRKQVKDLPFDFVLDDSMAMNPSMKLSSFEQVVVGARVSKSGNAMPQPGDLEGASQPINSIGSEAVNIEINAVVGQ